MMEITEVQKYLLELTLGPAMNKGEWKKNHYYPHKTYSLLDCLWLVILIFSNIIDASYSIWKE